MRKFCFKPLLAALLLLCSTVATAHDFEVGGIYYNITSSTAKTVAVTCKGSSYYEYSNEYSGVVTIPSSVTYSGSTYSVTSIGDRAFCYCTGLASVVIPNSVTSIGDRAFLGCISLTSVEIPNSVQTVDWYAFNGCSNLASVKIAGGVTILNRYAFQYCENLKDVTLSEGLETIGHAALSHCGYVSLIIPNSVTTIEEYAFDYCEQLESVTIGSGVTSIGFSTFDGCTGLAEIYAMAETPATIAENTFTNNSERSMFPWVQKQHTRLPITGETSPILWRLSMKRKASPAM